MSPFPLWGSGGQKDASARGGVHGGCQCPRLARTSSAGSSKAGHQFDQRFNQYSLKPARSGMSTTPSPAGVERDVEEGEPSCSQSSARSAKSLRSTRPSPSKSGDRRTAASRAAAAKYPTTPSVTCGPVVVVEVTGQHHGVQRRVHERSDLRRQAPRDQGRRREAPAGKRRIVCQIVLGDHAGQACVRLHGRRQVVDERRTVDLIVETHLVVVGIPGLVGPIGDAIQRDHARRWSQRRCSA